MNRSMSALSRACWIRAAAGPTSSWCAPRQRADWPGWRGPAKPEPAPVPLNVQKLYSRKRRRRKAPVASHDARHGDKRWRQGSSRPRAGVIRRDGRDRGSQRRVGEELPEDRRGALGHVGLRARDRGVGARHLGVRAGHLRLRPRHLRVERRHAAAAAQQPRPLRLERRHSLLKRLHVRPGRGRRASSPGAAACAHPLANSRGLGDRSRASD